MHKIVKKLLLVSGIILFPGLIVAGITKDSIKIAKAMSVENVVPVAVIGAGPAGLSAAVYTARAKLPTYVFTGGNLGGHLNDIERIENWPAIPRTTGARIAKRLDDQAQHFGARIVHDTIKDVDFDHYPFKLRTSRGNVVNALSVVIATGFEQQKLDIPGVDAYWGNGIGICTICDAPFARGQNVIVIGDDDFAAERVIQLAAYAKKVTLITRKSKLNITAMVKEYLDELDNLEIQTRRAVTEVVGDGTKVTGIRIRNLETGKEEVLPTNVIYLNSTYKPTTELFKNKLALDADGYIKISSSQETSIPGIFAAGAVSNKPNKAGPCAGFGMAAGVQVINFMHKIVGFSPDTQEQLQEKFFNPRTIRALESIPAVTTRSQLKRVFSQKPITIMFAFAPSCPFCKRMYPDVVAIAQEFQDTVQLVTLPSQDSNELVESLDFDSLPTTFIYSDGKLVNTLRGVTKKQVLYNVIHHMVTEHRGSQ